MRTTTRWIAIVAGLGLLACARQREPEAVEPETTATTGGAMTTQPQSGTAAEMEMQPRSDVQLEEPAWGEPTTPPPDVSDQYGMTGEPYGRRPGMQQPGTRQPDMAEGTEPTMSDEELRMQIENALRGAPNLEDNAISVRIEGGQVFLAGLVDSPTEIRIAHDVVSAIPGVANVNTDELRVQ